MFKPREGDLVVLHRDGKRIRSEGLLYEGAFAFNQSPQILYGGVGETVLRHGNRESGFLSCEFGFEALLAKCLNEPLNLVTVGAVVKGKLSGLADGEVVHLISAGRNSEVLGLTFEDFGDCLDQLFAVIAGYVVVNCHDIDLLVFGVVHISLWRPKIASYTGVESCRIMWPRNCVL
ncbi:hypothetical protein SDC9_203748 [bioreactor metagenome]|uniref:Uncharacterized protein n=1 Tax=bioreactor metagenome TaxID=1076179 RepID=A0A645IYX8_9ZZZZ